MTKTVRKSFLLRTFCAITALTGTAVLSGDLFGQTSPGPQPNICVRSCWSARAGSTSHMSGLDRAVIHHTAGTGDYNVSSIEDSKANVRAIQNLHMSYGWGDIGYHFLVDKLGNTFEGRVWSYVLSERPRGAHDGTNTNSFGFNVMGYYHPPYNQAFTTASRNALWDVIAWRMPSGWSPYGSGTYNGKTVGRVAGHRNVKSTACPGDGVYATIGTDFNGGEARNAIATRRTQEPPKNIDVYVRATDNSIRYKRYHGYYGVWDGSFTNLGGSMSSDPTSASWGEGRVDVFAPSSSGTLHHKWYWNGAWSPAGSWEDLGAPPGGFTGSPDACSWGSGHLDVYVRGNDNGLWHRGYSGSWSSWELVPGTLGTVVSDPTAVAWGAFRVDAFYRGTNNALKHVWWNGSWNGIEDLGGPLQGGPDACSWGSGHLDVYSRGTDGKIYHRGYSGGGVWGGWTAITSGAATADPSVASWGAFRIDAFYRNGDGSLGHRWFNGSWNGPENLGGILVGGPDASSWNRPQ